MDAGNTERQITEEQIRRFAENLKRQEYGAGTIENYVRSIRAFSVWCQGLPDKAGVLAWKAHLIDCYAPASVNAMLAGINCLFKFQGWSDCPCHGDHLRHGHPGGESRVYNRGGGAGRPD